MGKFDQFCQSCGMPMNMDPNGGGTEKDGSKSKKYCSHCYAAGAFLGDCKTADEMVAFCRKILKDKGHGFIKRWFYTSHIPRLERWKK